MLNQILFKGVKSEMKNTITERQKYIRWNQQQIRLSRRSLQQFGRHSNGRHTIRIASRKIILKMRIALAR